MFTFDKNRIQFVSIKDLVKTVERNSLSLNLSSVISERGFIAWLYGQFRTDVLYGHNRPSDFFMIDCNYNNPVDLFMIGESNDIKPIHGISITHVLNTMINNKYEFYGKGYDRVGFIKRELEEFFKYRNIDLDFNLINFNFNIFQSNSINRNQKEQEIERLKNENERLKNENKRLENENKELKKELLEKDNFISSLRLNEFIDNDPLAAAVNIRRKEWNSYVSADKTAKPKKDVIVAGLKTEGYSDYLANIIERVACPIER